jgi:hypothetical protein
MLTHEDLSRVIADALDVWCEDTRCNEAVFAMTALAEPPIPPADRARHLGDLAAAVLDRSEQGHAMFDREFVKQRIRSVGAW